MERTMMIQSMVFIGVIMLIALSADRITALAAAVMP
jgi:hypothetical protein